MTDLALSTRKVQVGIYFLALVKILILPSSSSKTFSCLVLEKPLLLYTTYCLIILLFFLVDDITTLCKLDIIFPRINQKFQFDI